MKVKDIMAELSKLNEDAVVMAWDGERYVRNFDVVAREEEKRDSDGVVRKYTFLYLG